MEFWSDNIIVLELQEGPAFSDDLNAVMDQLEQRSDIDVVISFATIPYLNSSNIAQLLRIRKRVVINNRRRMVLCGIDTSVWSLFLVTGLDKVFEFADDVANGLATVQLASE
ncbi:MAG: STAS domain-containing protein [Phycisphaerae bacterium]